MTAILLFFSCYKTKLKNMFLFGLILHLIHQNLTNTNIVFGIINFTIILGLVCFARLLKNANTILSIFIKVIYSVIIDIVSYFYWQISVYGFGLFDYIMQGIVFNIKDVFLSVLFFSVIVVINKILGATKNENRFIRCR